MTELVMNTPRARGLFVLTAHPEGCRMLVRRQGERAAAAFEKPLPGAAGRTALILGSTSFGYGSSAAIALREAGFERIIGVGYETAPTFRGEKVAMSSPGWYLTEALHAGDSAYRSYFADAFSAATRDRVVADLRREGLKVDLLLYSLAAPRREHLGQKWTSALHVLGDPLEVVGLDFRSGELGPITIPSASELEVEHTRRVMGGDDLEMWVNALLYSDLAAEGMFVTALSYIGPELPALRRIYWDGSLGEAKKHVDATTRALDSRVSEAVGGRALSVMNPAVVTTASVAIPAMLRYIADYLGCAETGIGLYADPMDVGIDFARALYGGGGDGEGGGDDVRGNWRDRLDAEGRLRLDGHELEPKLQQAIAELWARGEVGPPAEITRLGLERFKREHAMLYGWQVEGVDYEVPCVVDPAVDEAMGVIQLID